MLVRRPSEEKNFDALLSFESSYYEPGWKSERLAELTRTLERNKIHFLYLGLRSFKGVKRRAGGFGWYVTLVTPSHLSKLVSRLTGWFGVFVNSRDVRSSIASILFRRILGKYKSRVLFVQSTLGRIAVFGKTKGCYVIVECDMTDPIAHHRIISLEYEAFQIPLKYRTELPTVGRLRNEQRSFSQADKIIVFSDWSRAQFPEPLRRKVTVVHPISLTPEVEHSQGGGAACERELHLLRFLFVGQVGFRKGFHLLLKAWELGCFSDTGAEIDVYGAINPSIRWLLAQSDPVPRDGINFRGTANWRQVVRDQKLRHVLVLPSLVEGSPRVVYEAAALGVPVIASPAASPAFLKDGVNGSRLTEVNAEELSRSMAAYVRDPVLWSSISGALKAERGEIFCRTYGDQIARLIRNIT